MISKWLEELRVKGEIVDYDITCDDLTKEYIVHYTTPAPIKLFLYEFTFDPASNQITFKEEDNE